MSNKRVINDYKNICLKPLPGCYVRMNDDDSNLWDAVIDWQLSESIVAPLHLLIHFPVDYPSKPPSVGFSVHIGYTDGAGKIMFLIIDFLNY